MNFQPEGHVILARLLEPFVGITSLTAHVERLWFTFVNDWKQKPNRKHQIQDLPQCVLNMCEQFIHFIPAVKSLLQNARFNCDDVDFLHVKGVNIRSSG